MEKPPEESNPESDIGSEKTAIRRLIESVPENIRHCFKEWWKLGVVGAGLFVVTAHEIKEYSETKGWRENVELQMESEDMKELETKIVNLFGKEYLEKIKEGDRTAYLERKKDRREPSFWFLKGEKWEHIRNFGFTEKHLLYPKGWINGEVNNVLYIPAKVPKLLGNMAGLFAESPGNSVVLFKSYDGQEQSYIKMEVMDHEIAHANDWETDMDLNLRDRYEQVLKIITRFSAADAYIGNKYPQSFVDGSKKGFYKAIKEYWAEICSQYFSNPEKFKSEHPNDFSLVDEYAKKNDATFDVFNPNRGVFDARTGEMKEYWKDKLKVKE